MARSRWTQSKCDGSELFEDSGDAAVFIESRETPRRKSWKD
jgi:hypothetical protein